MNKICVRGKTSLGIQQHGVKSRRPKNHGVKIRNLKQIGLLPSKLWSDHDIDTINLKLNVEILKFGSIVLVLLFNTSIN